MTQVTTPIYDQCVDAIGAPGEHHRADLAEAAIADAADLIPTIAEEWPPCP